MAFNRLRDFIDYLAETPGELIRVKDEIDPLYEASAVLKAAAARASAPAVLFENVRGYPGMRAVGNILARRQRLAMAAGIAPHELNVEYLRRVENPVKPVVVYGGPVKDVIIKENIDLRAQLPVFTFNEKDSGPFISSGVVIAKEPGTGNRSMGIHRLEVKGPNRLGILLSSPPVATFFAQAEARGEPLEVAIAIGVDPLTVIASVVHVVTAVDKFEIAGALREAPVELVKGETVDVEVPKDAEFVIEGRVLPGEREYNGPFGESSGYYMGFDGPIVEVTAITHRRDPIFYAIEPWSGEVENLFFAGQVAMFRELRRLVPSIRDLAIVSGSVGSTVAISMKKTTAGEAKRALSVVLGMGRIKRAIAVDDDVDINNPRELEWALSTRFQGDDDLIVLKGIDGSTIDPSMKAGRISTALGFDATRPLGNPPEFEKIASPPGYLARAEQLLDKQG